MTSASMAVALDNGGATFGRAAPGTNDVGGAMPASAKKRGPKPTATAATFVPFPEPDSPEVSRATSWSTSWEMLSSSSCIPD
jgi:hypothetical protein